MSANVCKNRQKGHSSSSTINARLRSFLLKCVFCNGITTDRIQVCKKKLGEQAASCDHLSYKVEHKTERQYPFLGGWLVVCKLFIEYISCGVKKVDAVS